VIEDLGKYRSLNEAVETLGLETFLSMAVRGTCTSRRPGIDPRAPEHVGAAEETTGLDAHATSTRNDS